MRKVLKFVALLPFRIMSIPVIVALFVLQWIGIFLVSMSSWIFQPGGDDNVHCIDHKSVYR